MPPGFEPLLAAVCAAPWDDLPRLVFADFLDDHGEPERAEFIRLQCDIGDSAPISDPRRKRTRELSRRNMEAWRAELPRLHGVGWGRFRRGFAESVSLSCDSGLSRLKVAVRTVPVCSLACHHITPIGFRRFAASELVGQVSRLAVGFWSWSPGPLIDDTGIETLATNPAWGRLRSLRLNGWPRVAPATLGDRTALALATSPHLRALSRVSLTGALLSPAGRATLEQRFGRGLRLRD